MKDFQDRTAAIQRIIDKIIRNGFVPNNFTTHASLKYVLNEFQKKFRYQNKHSAGNLDAFRKLRDQLRNELFRDIKEIRKDVKALRCLVTGEPMDMTFGDAFPVVPKPKNERTN